jgi:hypothetical protein
MQLEWEDQLWQEPLGVRREEPKGSEPLPWCFFLVSQSSRSSLGLTNQYLFSNWSGTALALSKQ